MRLGLLRIIPLRDAVLKMQIDLKNACGAEEIIRRRNTKQRKRNDIIRRRRTRR